MKTKLKNEKERFIFLTLAIMFFIIGYAKTLPFSIDFTIASGVFLLMFVPYIVLAVSAFLINEFNAKKVVVINLLATALLYIIDLGSSFMYLLPSGSQYLLKDNYTLTVCILLIICICTAFLVTLFSKRWLTVYCFIMCAFSVAIWWYFILNDVESLIVGIVQLAQIFFYLSLDTFTKHIDAENPTERESNDTNEDEIFCFDGIMNLFANTVALQDESGELLKYYQFYDNLCKQEFDKIKECGQYGKQNFLIPMFKCLHEFSIKIGVFSEDTRLFYNITKCLSDEFTDDETFSMQLCNFADVARNYKLATNKVVNESIDIKYHSDDTKAKALSNFNHYPFTFCNEKFESMEAFLQSLKVKNQVKSHKIAGLYGIKAKKAGWKHQLWKTTGSVYFAGEYYNRFDNVYEALLSVAYEAMCNQNEDFRNTLLDTISDDGMCMRLEHSVGKDSKSETILTKEEFINALYYARHELIKKQKAKENKNG
ncbi:MAG: hypothetical protein J1E81_02540 [Eubacterium sp.]|nr:hypothetical protein [Eubacterium sp.]